MRKIEPGTTWRHFKGNYYLVQDLATDATTNKLVVIYRALYDNNALYVRNLDEFMECIIERKDNVTNQLHRFEQINLKDKTKE